QLADGDAVPLQGKFRDVLGNVVVESELAALHLLHHGDAGERQHRSDYVVNGLIFSRGFQTQVGKAVTFMENDAAAARDQYRGSHDVLAGNDILGDLVKLGR